MTNKKCKEITHLQRVDIQYDVRNAVKLANKELSKSEDCIKKASWIMRTMLDTLPEKLGITKTDFQLMRLIHEEPYRMMFRMSGNWYLNDLRDLIRFIEYNLVNLAEELEGEDDRK